MLNCRVQIKEKERKQGQKHAFVGAYFARKRRILFLSEEATHFSFRTLIEQLVHTSQAE